MQANADISHARIGDRGAEAFASALSVSPIITKISLKDNRLSLEGLTYILQSLLARMQCRGGKELLKTPKNSSSLAQPSEVSIQQ